MVPTVPHPVHAQAGSPMNVNGQHMCTICQTQKAASAFWDPDDGILRTQCNQCRFRRRAQSGRRLAVRAKKRKARTEVDAWWEEQARTHP